MVEYQWLANFGFAAIIAVYALVRLEKTVQAMTRQLKLNTIILARITGQDYQQVERDFAEESGCQ